MEKEVSEYKWHIEWRDPNELRPYERNAKVHTEEQIKQFEHHDYIVFVFDNQFDWLNVCDRFGLEKVDAGYGKTKKIGLGRVLDGKRLLEALEHQDSDPEQGQS